MSATNDELLAWLDEGQTELAAWYLEQGNTPSAKERYDNDSRMFAAIRSLIANQGKVDAFHALTIDQDERERVRGIIDLQRKYDALVANQGKMDALVAMMRLVDVQTDDDGQTWLSIFNEGGRAAILNMTDRGPIVLGAVNDFGNRLRMALAALADAKETP